MSGPRVVSVCTSPRRGVPKRAEPMVVLRSQHGIEGDAHAGPGHRQVSLLDLGDIDDMRATGLRLRAGAFGENLVISGLDTRTLGLGTRLGVGHDAVLEISQRGKTCHRPCAIYFTTGDCIMPRQGLFATVERGGRVAAGDPLGVLELVPRERLQAAVVGEGGAASTAAGVLEHGAGARLAWRGPLPREGESLGSWLAELCGRGLDLVVVSDPRARAAVAALPPVPEAPAGQCAGAVVTLMTDGDAAAAVGALLAAHQRLRDAGVGPGGRRLPDGGRATPAPGGAEGR